MEAYHCGYNSTNSNIYTIAITSDWQQLTRNEAFVSLRMYSKMKRMDAVDEKTKRDSPGRVGAWGWLYGALNNTSQALVESFTC